MDMHSDDLNWEKLLRREAGDALYAVTTMGVYCRLGCPSRPPLRRNVRFFPDWQGLQVRLVPFV